MPVRDLVELLRRQGEALGPNSWNGTRRRMRARRAGVGTARNGRRAIANRTPGESIHQTSSCGYTSHQDDRGPISCVQRHRRRRCKRDCGDERSEPQEPPALRSRRSEPRGSEPRPSEPSDTSDRRPEYFSGDDCGNYPRSQHEEIYTANNDIEDTVVVMPYGASGNEKPARVFSVPHQAWGLALGNLADQIAVTVEVQNTIVFYRRQVKGVEAPVRI